MKTLKNLTAGLLAAAVLTSSVFATEPANQKHEMNYALTSYVDAMAHGKISGLSEVLDKDVKFTSTRGEQIVSFSKNEVLNSLKNAENVEQNCSTAYHVIESNPTLTVVKLVMKYDTFSKVTYLSMANTTKGWKITNVSSTFI